MPTPATLAFYFLAAVAIVCGIGVATSRNMLVSALMLLGTLLAAAGLYLTMGADFVGMAQLLIYVGGVLVLLIFAVLLTAGIGDLRTSNASVAWGPRLFAGTIIALLAGAVGSLSWAFAWPRTEAVAAPTTERIGDAFLTDQLLPFELASFILLFVLVGAMMVARSAAARAERKAS